MSQPIQLWDYQRPLRLTVDEFFRMADAGAFERFTRTELIDGEVLTTNAQFSRHGLAKSDLAFALKLWCDDIATTDAVVTETTVSIAPDSAPEPDIILASIDRTVDGPVPAAAVKLAIEVSSSTLEIDLGRKARLYACAGIAEYWVVDLDGRIIRQFWSPAGTAYADTREIPFGQPITAATIAGLSIATTNLG